MINSLASKLSEPWKSPSSVSIGSKSPSAGSSDSIESGGIVGEGASESEAEGRVMAGVRGVETALVLGEALEGL